VALPATPVFDPGDPATWPDQLSQAQAKKVMVVVAGGDKTAAASMWADVADGPWSAVMMRDLFDEMCR
jgi:hypothetical protein